MSRIRMIKIMGILFMIAVFAVSAVAQKRTNQNEKQNNGAGGTCLRLVDTIPVQTLSAAEAEKLTYLREEEKLAHDVYLQMSFKYSLPIFQKISQSEERHFSALKVLLDRYALPDPAAGKDLGEFSNTSLQTLYVDLIDQGTTSLLAALRVGFTIEELDIRNLRKALETTDNSDLQRVYGNLLRGSENHLRAFSNRLLAMGETGTAQYLDETTLAEINASQNPKGGDKGFRGNGRMRNGLGNGACLQLGQ